MSEEKKSGFHPSQLAVAALAAVSAAVLGSTLGVAGTVLGAALGAIVSTVTTELYSRSYERVRYRVTKSPDVPQEDTAQTSTRKVRWPLLAGISIAAFALGMIVITGIEWARGEPLSGDAQTTIGGVLQRPAVPAGKPDKPGNAPSSTTVTVTQTPSSPPPTTVPAPSSSTHSPSSSSSTPSASATDPVQSSAISQQPGSP